MNAGITKLLRSDPPQKHRKRLFRMPAVFPMIISVLLTAVSYRIVNHFKKILLQCYQSLSAACKMLFVDRHFIQNRFDNVDRLNVIRFRLII